MSYHVQSREIVYEFPPLAIPPVRPASVSAPHVTATLCCPSMNHFASNLKTHRASQELSIHHIESRAAPPTLAPSASSVALTLPKPLLPFACPPSLGIWTISALASCHFDDSGRVAASSVSRHIGISSLVVLYGDGEWLEKSKPELIKRCQSAFVACMPGVSTGVVGSGKGILAPPQWWHALRPRCVWGSHWSVPDVIPTSIETAAPVEYEISTL